MKLLIINADDFGLSPGVNRAVVKAHEEGVLTSTSLMVTFPGFEEAVSLAHAHPKLEVGLHVVLAKGKPVLPPREIPSLVDRQGSFLPRSVLLWRALTGCLKQDEVEREVCAQAERFLEQGLSLAHINGDQHVHVFPVVREVVVDLARRLNTALRVPQERFVWRGNSGGYLQKPSDWFQFIKKSLLQCWSRRFRQLCHHAGVLTNDDFISPFGLFPGQRPDPESFRKLLSEDWKGVCELMVHPGFPDEGLKKFWGSGLLAEDREREFLALTSTMFKEALKAHRIKLVGYRAVCDNQ